MNKTLFRIWLIGSLLLALTLGPYLTRGSSSELTRRQQNADLLAKMSASERERMERNFKMFQQLSEPERAQLRSIHWAVTSSGEPEQSELNFAMQQYYQWLMTIEPYQRDQLNKTTDPRARIDLMRDIVRQQRERTANRAFPGSDRRNFWGPSFSSAELKKIMDVIEQAAQPRLTQEQQEALNMLEGINRDIRLLQYLRDLNVNKEPLNDAPPIEFQAVLKRLDELVANPEVRRFLNSPEPEENDENHSTPLSKLTRVLATSLVKELLIYRSQSAKRPTQKELMEYFESLEPEEQDRLLALEASDFYTDLLAQYPRPDRGDNPRDLFELFMGSDFRRRRFQRFDRSNDDRPRERAADGRNPADPPGPRNFIFRDPEGRNGEFDLLRPLPAGEAPPPPPARERRRPAPPPRETFPGGDQR